MSWRDSHLLGKSRGTNPYTAQFPVGYLSHYTVPHTKDRGPGKYMPFAADLKVQQRRPRTAAALAAAELLLVCGDRRKP